MIIKSTPGCFVAASIQLMADWGVLLFLKTEQKQEETSTNHPVILSKIL
jgi:hypothetical protein